MALGSSGYSTGLVGDAMDVSDDRDLSNEEIVQRMNAAVRRALNTPPKPTKEMIGKSERAIAQRESRVRKARPSGPKSP
jgi:hypothetical protein